MTNYEMTADDWAEFDAQVSPRPKPEPTPTARPPIIGEQEGVERSSQFASPTPTTISPAQAPTPKTPEPAPVLDLPIQIRSADEFLAEHYRKGDGPSPEASAARELVQPLSLPMRNGATGNPPALGRHQTTARTEVVELRREVAELTRIVSELAPMVAEIHQRVFWGGQ